jgi:2-C-methyl-D-erythritol 4-phosphate cytidylyltransferase/2-C-methyl-D-erythritol 2,4-cyclodiphosphate synthase
MSNLSLVLLSAGESSRFKTTVKKQWLRVDGVPLWQRVLERFEELKVFEKIILTVHRDEKSLFQKFTNVEIVVGGNSRQQSIERAISKIDTEFVAISDIARCFISEEMIFRLVESRYLGDVIAPYIPVSDSVVFGEESIDRDKVKLIQTPQISKTAILKELLKNADREFTDESSLFVSQGFKRFFVLGDKRAGKVTFLDDIKSSKCFQNGKVSTNIRVGTGFDVHQFEIKDGGILKLGGVEISSPLSFKAHSDGDVLIHSLIDAILGASSMGDIGELFPDNDRRYKNINSIELLKIVKSLVEKIGLEIVHIDITVIAEIPRLKNYKNEIQSKLAEILNLRKSSINIKATTTEKLGFIGRKEGLSVLSTATIKDFDWRDLIHES